MKIFCIGLNKTGTTALMIGLQRMGYKVCDGLAGEWNKATSTEAMKACAFDKINAYEAFEDLPWGLYYKDLHERYPDAKFIYSHRNVDTWWHSFYSHFKAQKIKHHAIVYGYDNPENAEAEHKAFFLKHQEEVRAYFKDKSSIYLELDFTKKTDSAHNWEKFCAFMGQSYTLGDKFPLANTKADRLFWNHLRRLKRRLGF